MAKKTSLTSIQSLELAGDLDINELQTLKDLLLMDTEEGQRPFSYYDRSSGSIDVRFKSFSQPEISKSISNNGPECYLERQQTRANKTQKRLITREKMRKPTTTRKNRTEQLELDLLLPEHRSLQKDRRDQLSHQIHEWMEMQQNPETICDVCHSTIGVKCSLGGIVCGACRAFYYKYRDNESNLVCIGGRSNCEINDLRKCPCCRWKRMVNLGLQVGFRRTTMPPYQTRSTRPTLEKPKSEPVEGNSLGTKPTKVNSKATSRSQVHANRLSRRQIASKVCTICQSPNNVSGLVCNSCLVFCRYYRGKPIPKCSTGLKRCRIYYKDKNKCRYCRIHGCITVGSESISSYIPDNGDDRDISETGVSTHCSKTNDTRDIADQIVIQLSSSESVASPENNQPQDSVLATSTDKPELDILDGNFSTTFYGDLTDFRPGSIPLKKVSDEVVPGVQHDKTLVKRCITTSKIDIDPDLKLISQRQVDKERERSPEPIDKIRTYFYDINWKTIPKSTIEQEYDVVASIISISETGVPIECELLKSSLSISLKSRETTIDRRPMLCKKVKLMNGEDNSIGQKRKSLIAPEEDCDSDIELIEIDCDS